MSEPYKVAVVIERYEEKPTPNGTRYVVTGKPGGIFSSFDEEAVKAIRNKVGQGAELTVVDK